MKNLVFLIAILLLPASISQAQQTADSHFGHGVTSYFSGNSQSALSSLNSAISLNPNDARYYFFRGLAQRMSGNTYAGDSDFQMGASLEARSGNGRSTKVSRSLERVQGRVRLKIEEIRRDARKAREYARLHPPQAVIPTTYYQPVYPSYSPQVMQGTIIESMPSGVIQSQGVVIEQNQIQPQNSPSNIAVPSNAIEAAPPTDQPAEADPFGGQPVEQTPPPAEDNADEASPFGNAVEPPTEDTPPPSEDASPFGDAADSGPEPDTGNSPFGADEGGNPFGGNDTSGDAGGGDAGGESGSGVVDDPFSGN